MLLSITQLFIGEQIKMHSSSEDLYQEERFKDNQWLSKSAEIFKHFSVFSSSFWSSASSLEQLATDEQIKAIIAIYTPNTYSNYKTNSYSVIRVADGMRDSPLRFLSQKKGEASDLPLQHSVRPYDPAVFGNTSADRVRGCLNSSSVLCPARHQRSEQHRRQPATHWRRAKSRI